MTAHWISRKYYEYIYKEWKNPTLTSNTSNPDFKIVASGTGRSWSNSFSIDMITYPNVPAAANAWMAFDNGSVSSQWAYYYQNWGQCTAYIVVELGNPVRVTNYGFVNMYDANGGSHGSDQVYLWGSNDYSTWTLIAFESFSGQPNRWRPVTNIIDSTNYYKYLTFGIGCRGVENDDFGGVSEFTVGGSEQIEFNNYIRVSDRYAPIVSTTEVKDYSVASGSRTIEVYSPCDVTIELIGGGGAAAQTDGGTDRYGDTAWAWHYGHNGGSGARFKGVARLTRGTLEIVSGAAGYFNAESVSGGSGGDSYAIFTPEGGSAVEIARARGGQGGRPAGSSYGVSSNGGTVTYNNEYIVDVIVNTSGSDGGVPWSVHI